MNLKIEGGFLLKPYQAPYSRKEGGKHRIPDGWTPDRTAAMQVRFNELRLDDAGKDVPDYLLWKKVEYERGAQLIKLRRPYPGWFPIGPKRDKAISRAYRELFLRMNPDADKRVLLAGQWSGPKAIVPPDGDYVLEGGIMRPAMEESVVNAMVADGRIDEAVGEMLRVATRGQTND